MLIALEIALVGAVLAGAWAIAAVRRRRLRAIAERWRALAPRLELALDGAGATRLARLSGRFRGQAVEVVVHGDGRAEMRAGIDAPLPKGLHLLHRRTVEALKVQGLRDSIVGVPDFDRDVVVHSEHPAATIRLLRDERAREAVYALLREYPGARVAGADAMVLLSPDAPDDALKAALRRLTDAAYAVAEAARDLALEARQTRESSRAEVPELVRPRFTPLSDAFLYQRNVLAAAARQRRIIYGMGLVPIGVGVLAMAGAVGLEHLLGPSSALGSWRLGGSFAMGLGIAAMSLGAAHYRCPACREPVRGPHEAIDLVAPSCRSCGIRLR